jgi:phenylpropionate dioxygenase-like ring-hydroxylating dioxygenase large terminal subunit
MSLIETIQARAALPLEQARALPGECYTSRDLYDLEVAHIFRKEWICVARAEQVPNPGDWLALDLVGEPLMIVRDNEGALRALSRVCPHRAQDVLNAATERSGNAARFTCPYHSWSYRLDGSCIGAPDMQGQAFDAADCGLGTFALEVWQGFVFVCLDPQPPSFAAMTSGVTSLMNDVDLTDWHIARTLPWGEQPVNWKVVIENAVECYHHMGPHASTLEPIFPHASVDVEVSPDDHWLAGHMVVAPGHEEGEADGHRLHPLFFAQPGPGVSSLQRSATTIAGIYPMFFFALSPDYAAWFDWLPTGPDSHRIDIHLLLPPAAAAQPDREAILDFVAETLNTIQAEDVHNNVGVQRSLGSVHATGGPLSRLEYPIWRFQRYLAARLT